MLSLHLIICVALILVVLVQQGKSGSGGLMGGASSTMFGSLGSAPFMVKMTAILALAFFISSFTLSYLIKLEPSKSLVTDVAKGKV